MAAKLKCPTCDIVMKQEGDEGKNARGEYRVYDSLPNLKRKAGVFRVIHCLTCNAINPICDFELF